MDNNPRFSASLRKWISGTGLPSWNWDPNINVCHGFTVDTIGGLQTIFQAFHYCINNRDYSIPYTSINAAGVYIDTIYPEKQDRNIGVDDIKAMVQFLRDLICYLCDHRNLPEGMEVNVKTIGIVKHFFQMCDFVLASNRDDEVYYFSFFVTKNPIAFTKTELIIFSLKAWNIRKFDCGTFDRSINNRAYNPFINFLPAQAQPLAPQPQPLAPQLQPLAPQLQPYAPQQQYYWDPQQQQYYWAPPQQQYWDPQQQIWVPQQQYWPPQQQQPRVQPPPRPRTRPDVRPFQAHVNMEADVCMKALQMIAEYEPNVNYNQLPSFNMSGRAISLYWNVQRHGQDLIVLLESINRHVYNFRRFSVSQLHDLSCALFYDMLPYLWYDLPFKFRRSNVFSTVWSYKDVLDQDPKIWS